MCCWHRFRTTKDLGKRKTGKVPEKAQNGDGDVGR
jgi:hypothetical protein